MTAADARFLRGVNVAGAEFGAGRLPGVLHTDYTYNSEATFRYFAARNLRLIRFPLQWERLQPALGGPLDPPHLELLKEAVRWARTNGNLLIPEIHNFARYRGCVASSGHLADLWVRLSVELRDEPSVYAYGLMNEPHDVAGWKKISQAVLTAIRHAGDGKLILVPGDGWSSARRWRAVHGPRGWISDPADNFLYEAHQYFDFDESGAYARSYDAELRANPALATVGSTRVSGFIEWCRSNGVRGFLGEYGVPDSDPRWCAVLDDFLQTLDAAGMSGAYWAAGEWWGGYPLSVQPTDNFTVDRPQMGCLLAHLPPGVFTSVSAASNGGLAFAPGSLMAGYGAGLFGRGVIVEVTDSTGRVHPARVQFATSRQINYWIPQEAALGNAGVAVIANGEVVARGSLMLEELLR